MAGLTYFLEIGKRTITNEEAVILYESFRRVLRHPSQLSPRSINVHSATHVRRKNNFEHRLQLSRILRDIFRVPGEVNLAA
jgi:hypothetical protein